LNKLDKENVSAVMVVPNWPSQTWWPSMMNKTKKWVIAGKSEDVLKAGGRMKK
jgi:hypothetical protein